MGEGRKNLKRERDMWSRVVLPRPRIVLSTQARSCYPKPLKRGKALEGQHARITHARSNMRISQK